MRALRSSRRRSCGAPERPCAGLERPYAPIATSPQWRRAARVATDGTSSTYRGPDGATSDGPQGGAAWPFVFSIDAFDNEGSPLAAYGDPAHPFAFEQTSGDAPTRSSVFGWTNYGTGNVNTSQVHQIITGELVVSRTLTFGEYIGQRNGGVHTALFRDVDAYLVGQDVPAPIVDDHGGFMGWAIFHVAAVDLPGGNDEHGGNDGDDEEDEDSNGTPHVIGWFLSSAISPDLTISGCATSDCPRYLGAYVLRLIN